MGIEQPIKIKSLSTSVYLDVRNGRQGLEKTLKVMVILISREPFDTSLASFV